ncbi:MAG: hypothetical protein J6Y94_08625, partial [Bacteriovoracaceae bacterium]|nr:hypothetical protein [Bacteriovoracaceae bacterium]
SLAQWEEGRGLIVQTVEQEYWAMSEVQQTALIKQLNTSAFSWIRNAIITQTEAGAPEAPAATSVLALRLKESMGSPDGEVKDDELQVKEQSWLGLFLQKMRQPAVRDFIEQYPVLAPFMVQLAQKSNNEKSFRAGQKLLSLVSQVVERLPRLAPSQKTHLTQALTLYEQFGLNLKNAGYEFNTRFSFAHLVRLSTTLQDLGEKLRVQGGSKGFKSLPCQLWGASQEFAEYLDPIREDLLRTFQMFRYGPKDIRPIADAVIKVTATFLGAASPNELVLNDHLQQRPFAQQFATDNAVLLGKATERYLQQYLNLMTQDLSWLESNKHEIKAMQTLTKVFVRGFFKQQNQDIKTLSSIFSEENREALARALGAMIVLQDGQLLREFLDQQGQVVKIVVQRLMTSDELTTQQISAYGQQMQSLLALTFLRAAEDLASELEKPTVELATIMARKAHEEQAALKDSLRALNQQINDAHLWQELSKEKPNFDFFTQDMTEVTANWKGISYSTLGLLQKLQKIMADLQERMNQERGEG